jgi:hypothetical protein
MPVLANYGIFRPPPLPFDSIPTLLLIRFHFSPTAVLYKVMVGHEQDHLNFSHPFETLEKADFDEAWAAVCKDALTSPPPPPRKPRSAPSKYTELVMAWAIMILLFIAGWIMAEIVLK